MNKGGFISFASIYVILLFYESAFPRTSGATITSRNENKMSSVAMPAMARKAGGSWRRELLEKQDSFEMTKVVETVESESADDGDGDYNYEDSYSEEEVECPKRYFYHVRGKQCVPLRCPGGNNTARDPETGECKGEEVRRAYYDRAPYRYRKGYPWWLWNRYRRYRY